MTKPATTRTAGVERHPRAIEPVSLILALLLSVLGSIIGLHLVTTLGISANTSVIGALIAMLIGRFSFASLRAMRSVHRQNLAQSAISASTFAAANALLTPIAVPFAFGRADLVWPMLVGSVAGLAVDCWMCFRIFDSKLMPGREAWPPGVAAAETIIAGDKGGRRAVILAGGGVVGFVGSMFGWSMSAAGVAFIGNIWALGMFGVGLLIAQYEPHILTFSLSDHYVPHGVMIGAGIVALIQAIIILVRRREARNGGPRNGSGAATSDPAAVADLSETAGTADAGDDLDWEPTVDERRLRNTLGIGYALFVAGALLLALVSGLVAHMSVPGLIGWLLLAGFAAIVHEIIVGLAAMHAGWFPAFAVTLIFLVIGLLIGIPGTPLALLVGYCAATGPAFADMGYDLKAGWILRASHRREHLAFELDGRRQQFFSALIGCAVAVVMVAILWKGYFSHGELPPAAKVYGDTIKAGLTSSTIVLDLVIWAIPGALIQLLGGPKRQMGILLATGLLIGTPWAGWLVLGALAIRVVYSKVRGPKAETELQLVGAGIIAGDSIAATSQVFKA